MGLVMGQDEHENREHDRRQTELQGTLVIEGRIVDCDILNISAGGGRVRSTEAFTHDGALTLHIEGFGEFAGNIAWRRGEIMGMKFHDDPEKVAETLMAILLYKAS